MRQPLGRLWRLLKVQRDCAVGPRIVQLMAAIAAQGHLGAQPPRGFRKAARLVTKLAGEQKQEGRIVLGRICQAIQLQTNVSGDAASRASEAMVAN